MASENSNIVKFVLTALADHACVKGIKGLADFLEEPPTTLYGWIRNGRIVDTGVILRKLPHINVDWLRSGKGQMALITKDMYQSGFPEKSKTTNFTRYSSANVRQPSGKIVATIQPGEEVENNQYRPETGEQDTFDEESMIEQTRYVLRSDTVYRGALASNIRAFYQGVKREEEMDGLETRITQMQIAQEERDIETHNKIDALTKMVVDAGILPKNKKRETSGGSGA